MGAVTEELPESASRQVEEEAKEDEFGAKDYRELMTLKLDHKARPLWVVCIVLNEIW